jgi:hypothetical protein
MGMIKRIYRSLLLLLAAVFLFEAWLWDKFTLLGHWLRDRLPLQALKRWVASRIERLPPWAALLLFVIPVIIVQPLKLAALWLMVHGHVVLGLIGFVAIKVVAFGAVAFLFDLTRDKLMTFGWFVWLYERVLWLRAKASAYIAPYKAALKARMAWLKKETFKLLGLKGERRSLLARLRARLRTRIRRL